jgi:hypothetical protein
LSKPNRDAYTTVGVAMADMIMADVDAEGMAKAAAMVAEDMVAAEVAKTKIMTITIGMSMKP